MRIGKLLKKFRKNNKGASFFVVIVAVLFLMLLSSSLIYASFTSYNVKLSSKRSNSAFYIADTAVEQIKTGFQKVVSDCAEKGYQKSLTQFNNLEENVTGLFDQGFKDAFFKYKYDSSNRLFLPGAEGLEGSNIGGVYINGLKSFLAPELKSKVDSNNLKISSNTDPSNTTTIPCIQKTENGKLTIIINGVKVEYSEDGYTSNITTDIKLKMPDVVLYGEDASVPLSKFVMIADQGLKTMPNSVNASSGLEITGSAFFGDIEVGQKKSITLANESTVYVGAIDRYKTEGEGDNKHKDPATEVTSNGKILLQDTAKFYAGVGTVLWAKDIELKNSAVFKSADASGNIGSENRIYVADDLSLSDKSVAEIAGYYYGFGDSSKTNESGSKLSDYASYSSSVLFPRRTDGTDDEKAKLDLTNCKEFHLAGTAYVQQSASDKLQNPDVSMGSSIASTREQLLYLVPAEYFGNQASSNPVFKDDYNNLDDLKNNVIPQMKNLLVSNFDSSPLFSVDGVPKYARNYGITTSEHIRAFTKNVGGGLFAVYYFFDFPTVRQANDYFKDYFSSDKGEKISNYIDSYAEILYNDKSVFRLNGTEFLSDGESILPTGSKPNSWCSVKYKDYQRISKTVTTSRAEEGSSPFYSIVDIDILKEIIDLPKDEAEERLAEISGYEDAEIVNYKPSDTYRLIKIPKKENSKNNQNFESSQVYIVISKDNVYIGDGNELPGVPKTGNNVVITKNDKNDENLPDATLQLVIADGDIVFNGAGEGILLLSSGTIYPGTAHIKMGKGNSGSLGEPSLVLKQSGFYKGVTNADNKDDWVPDDLVVFENWKKNEG